jgi:hypothetical protein
MDRMAPGTIAGLSSNARNTVGQANRGTRQMGLVGRVEEFFEDGKGQLGMAQYEARSRTGWHHHMSLVALAHLFVTQTRRDLRRKAPELTLDMAMRLIRASLVHPQLSLEDTEHLVDYYLTRNKRATTSHRRTWLTKHPNAVP